MRLERREPAPGPEKRLERQLELQPEKEPAKLQETAARAVKTAKAVKALNIVSAWRKLSIINIRTKQTSPSMPCCPFPRSSGRARRTSGQGLLICLREKCWSRSRRRQKRWRMSRSCPPSTSTAAPPEAPPTTGCCRSSPFPAAAPSAR